MATPTVPQFLLSTMISVALSNTSRLEYVPNKRQKQPTFSASLKMQVVFWLMLANLANRKLHTSFIP